jgi:hypothetical protein
LAVSSLLLFAACAPPTQTTANVTPESSPSAGGSASPSAVTSPTSVPTTVPPPTPSHAPALQITSANFHVGEVGVGYVPVTLLATGGVGSYTWSISVGSLPAGLTVSSTGMVSGTPTTAGTASFTVHVADTHGGSAIVNRSISVAKRLGIAALCATQCNVEIGCTTVCGKFGTLIGGAAPFTYAPTGGTALPPGMGLNGLSLTGPFPPEPAGTVPIPYSFKVQVTDAFGVAASVSATFGTYPQLKFLVASARCVGALSCATSSLQYTGGLPGSTPGWTATAVNANQAPIPLPAGFNVTFKGSSVIVTVPTQKSSYQGTITLILTDPAFCAPSTHCASSGPATITVFV